MLIPLLFDAPSFTPCVRLLLSTHTHFVQCCFSTPSYLPSEIPAFAGGKTVLPDRALHTLVSRDRWRSYVVFPLVHQASLACCRSRITDPQFPTTKLILSTTHLGATALSTAMMSSGKDCHTMVVWTKPPFRIYNRSNDIFAQTPQVVWNLFKCFVVWNLKKVVWNLSSTHFQHYIIPKSPII